MDLPADFSRRTTSIAGAAVLTAGAYFVSSGLHRVWWPVWLAPLPVLLVVPALRAWQAFAVALAARALAAALNFWHYVRAVVQFPVWLAAVTILVPAALFALAVVFYRGLLRRRSPWLAMLAFPVTLVAAEYLFSLWQGTFLSAGYTQLGNLPILQLAAITGLWGISFSVNLLPAGLAALVWAPARQRFPMAGALGAIYACILVWGTMRLDRTPEASHSVLVGTVETHAGKDMFPPDASSTMAMYEGYAAQIKSLAARGAAFVILPEMTALIPDSATAQVDEFFENTARNARVQVLLGVLHVTDHGAYNEGRLYSATGAIEVVYRKHHLVPTWESRSTPGTEIAVLDQPAGEIAIQICRDMDYPELSRRYAHERAGLMLVPAWDQGVDTDAAWHGHLSLMRGVESGFPMVRDAKNGLMTASDDRGRILAEEPTRSDGAFVTMLARVPVRHDPTLYEKWGDWFAWADLAGLAALLASLLTTRGVQPQRGSAEELVEASPALRNQT
jgi:apolipoprotein N-acyltransferase